MYTPRVGENTCMTLLSMSSYNSSVLALIHSLHRSKSDSSTTAEKQAFQTDLQLALNLNTFERNLNMEGKLERKEAALRGPRLHSLCVVLMSTFVQTVAFQIHANRRPVLCVALYWWSPL